MHNEEEILYDFNKFMNDIVSREQSSESRPPLEDQITPQREYIKKYRELPQNRTRWSR